jgi:phage gp36-like protein
VGIAGLYTSFSDFKSIEISSQLADRTDLGRLGLAAAVIASVATATQDEHLEAASRWADTRLRSRYPLPLAPASWGDDLKEVVCVRASWTLLCFRGFNPDRPDDVALKLRAAEVERLLRDVAAGVAHLAIAETPAATFPSWMEPLSDDPRGN